MTAFKKMILSKKFKGYAKTAEFRKSNDAVNAAKQVLPFNNKITDRNMLSRKREEIQMTKQVLELDLELELELDEDEDEDEPAIGVNEFTWEVNNSVLELQCAGSSCDIVLDVLLCDYPRVTCVKIAHWRGKNYQIFHGLKLSVLDLCHCDIRNLDLAFLQSVDSIHISHCANLTASGHAMLNRTGRLASLTL
jgi:hypothetical protein